MSKSRNVAKRSYLKSILRHQSDCPSSTMVPKEKEKKLDIVEAEQSEGGCPVIHGPFRRARVSTYIKSPKSHLRQTEDLLENGEDVGRDCYEKWWLCCV